MKKSIIFSGILLILLASCSVLSPAQPTPMPTLAPTPTPDPCSKDNILAEAEKVQMGVNEFREVADLANSTDVNFLFFPVLRLQEIRYEVINTEVPACLEAFKATAMNYTASVINYMIVFMNVQDPKSEDLANAIQNSQTQWQILTNEFNKVLTIAGVEPQVSPSTSSIEPTPTGVAVTATNEESQAVNVRVKPDLDSEIVTSIEKGEQAEVLGKNEAGDWLEVDLDGTVGWVFTETVVIDVPLEQLPVVQVTP